MDTGASVIDFVNEKLLGKGAFGKVYLCHSREDESRKYANKEIDISSAKSTERDTALREANLLSELKHENIVAYVVSYIEGTSLHIVTEYCDYGDLSKLIKQQHGRKFSESQIVNWFDQICTALEYLHTRNILHRDIKTQNIFLTGPNKDAKLGDMGLAKVLASCSATALTICGTIPYMSPEIWLGIPYNTKSDIWSLGIVVYEIATLQKPFDSSCIATIITQIKEEKQLPLPQDEYTNELCYLVDRMLEKDPGLRPTAKDIINEMVQPSFINRKRVEKIHNSVVSNMNDTEIAFLKAIEQKYSAKMTIDKENNNIIHRGNVEDMMNAIDDIYNAIRKFHHRILCEEEAVFYKDRVQWYFKDLDERGLPVLIEYPDLLNMDLELAYLADENSRRDVEFKDDKGLEYVVVLKDMKEYLKNDRSNKVDVLRRYKIQGDGSNFEHPPEWGEQRKHSTNVIELLEESPEYVSVEQKFLNSVFNGRPEWVNQLNKQSFKVTKIERVQNSSLYNMYATRKALMEKQNPTVAKNEQELWHGTPDSDVLSIILFGFNRSYCQDTSKDAFLGEGVYFSADASYLARGWLSKPTASDEHYMYLCKVLTGVSCPGRRGMRRLPFRPDGTLLDYDSVTDTNYNDKVEYVIFHDTQAYPQYCIKFKY